MTDERTPVQDPELTDVLVRAVSLATEGASNDDAEARTAALAEATDLVGAALAERILQLEAHAGAVADQRVQEARREGALAVLSAVVDLADLIDSAGEPGECREHTGMLRALDRRLDRVLSGQGFRRIATVGETFDPEVHEIVHEAVDGGGPADSNVIVEEVGRGYRSADLVLRPARVVVGRARE